jgi:hypothetical protein
MLSYPDMTPNMVYCSTVSGVRRRINFHAYHLSLYACTLEYVDALMFEFSASGKHSSGRDATNTGGSGLWVHDFFNSKAWGV